MKLHRGLVYTLAALAIPATGFARTKLVTLPDREKVVVSLENPNQALLYEEREIPLQQGTNFIDFSWTGVSIDQSSVMIAMLSNPGKGDDATKIIATGFPPNENALAWQVYSPEARTERVRVSYLLHGITTETSYKLRVNEKETAGDFDQYLLLRNGSGENLNNTIVRLPQMEDLERSVDTGEVRRFLAKEQDGLPVEKLFVARPAYDYYTGEEGEDIGLVFEIANNTDSGLGEYKLPAGKLRLFGDDGMGSSIFLGEDILKQTAPNEDTEINIGKVQDVKLKRFEMKDERIDVTYNDSKQPVLFDVERVLRYEIENFKKEPVTLKVYEPVNGDWSVREITDDGVRWERKTVNEMVVYIDLPANEEGQEAEKKEVVISLLFKNRFQNER